MGSFPNTVSYSAALRYFLRNKELLLVIDNCEHLTGACAQLFDSLLQACPNLRILATSRETLGLTGEVVWRVPTLPVPDAEHLPPLEQLTAYDAVQLFAERARAVKTNWTLAENVFTVAQICARLDGVPLAIELAAARLAALSTPQIAARLADRFQLLTGGSRTSLPRQQTLRATLDWSYDLLSGPERVLFRRLSMFAGGWTLEAAESVCSGEAIEQAGVLDLLERLVNKSLVSADDVGGGGRFHMLETVRQYAHEKLSAAGEGERLRAQHAEYCLRLAEESEQKLRSADQFAWLARLTSENDNLRAALTYYRAHPLDGLRLASALWWFWNLRSQLSEGRAWLAEFMAQAGQVERDSEGRRVRAKGLFAAGALAYVQDDYAAAQAALEQSIALYRALGDKNGLAYALSFLGPALHMRENSSKAHNLLQQGVALFRESGERWGLAYALHYLNLKAFEEG